MNRFVTLMKREWLQHRIGWLVLMVLPSAIMMGLSLIDAKGLQVQVDGDGTNLPPLALLPIPLQTVGWMAATAVLAFVLAMLSVLGQLAGLARRDIQDRSIEFWRSLPVNDAQAVGATVLMHLIVLPGLALVAGTLGALVVGAVAISLQHGFNAWLLQPWWQVAPAMVMLLLRMLLGLILVMAWLSPFLLLMMAASAWLKRWAVPVVVVGSVLAVQIGDRYLPVPLFQPVFKRLASEAMEAMLSSHSLRGLGLHFEGPADITAALPRLPAGLLADAGHVLANAATPAFLAALAVGAMGFGLLVWRRQRI